ncbi:MAG: NnrU family protein [Gammaproteobacteria bacterium]|nr:MAG: NnrU family protein [Gammaproteobacteria bacterium]
MTILIAGLVLFFAIHLLPVRTAWRQMLIDRLGQPGYTALFSVLSLAGILLILRGYGQVEDRALWTAPEFARGLAIAVMPAALILLVAAYLPTRLRARLRHPMLIGIAAWAAVHLLATGRLASTLLFGAFLGYALLDMALAKPRRQMIPGGEPRLLWDAIAIAGGLLAWVLLLRWHGELFGVTVMR